MDAMTEALSQLPTLVFLLVGTVAVASSILVVAMRNPVHSALFLLLTFLCVAIIFFLAHAEFVGAVQVLVYAGGIMVLFLFVVMLINVRHLPEEAMLSPYWKGGIGVGVALFVVFVFLVRGGDYGPALDESKLLRTGPVRVRSTVTNDQGEKVRRITTKQRVIGNTEAIGLKLYRDYLVPFEVASLFLLVAMIGAIVIGKRELGAMDEDEDPDFVVQRAMEEREVKERAGA